LVPDFLAPALFVFALRACFFFAATGARRDFVTFFFARALFRRAVLARGGLIDPKLTLENKEITRRHIRAFLLQNYHQDRIPGIDPAHATHTFGPQHVEVCSRPVNMSPRDL
jgi:hypothetical protein